jgi:phospholipid/cholesterol/gamma-HCH transport system substrate-binding protein
LKKGEQAMAKLFTNEFKTGLMVVVCLAILMTFTVSVGKMSIFTKEYDIKALFNKVAGVEKDAPVRLNGVEVGKVGDVALLYKDGQTKVLLTLTLNESAKLREGAKAYVTTLGLMGEKYIELTAGSEGLTYIKAGTIIPGEDPMQMEEMTDLAKRIGQQIELTLVDIRSLTKHLDEAVSGNRQNIDDIMGNLKRTTSNFEEFSDDIKRNPWKLLIKEKEKEKEDKNQK